MFRNLHFKILSLLLAIIFWIFIVSLENTFVKFSEPISLHALNQAPGLALTSNLGTVMLTLRAEDPVLVRSLTASDFDAYVDFENVGAGTQTVPVFVVSRKAQVSVMKVLPSEVEVSLEPLREKIFPLVYEVKGEPAEGFLVLNVALSAVSVAVQGGQSSLANVVSARASIELTGQERENFEQRVSVALYGAEGRELTGFSVKDEGLKAFVTIEPVAEAEKMEAPPESD